ncbi:MAG: patatin-like phospholipase family protein [Oscillospiraceae bacterium]|jgi:NTE family protein|nr:patatin-like phospholipase family protein [Oscillospiraceae bacterium]
MKCDAVFEGGGIKGIGFAGAIAALEEAGYTFENVAGTSAGAIAACLVASGYTGQGMSEALRGVDYRKFPQRPVSLSGPLGSLAHLTARLGLYRSDFFAAWLDELLAQKRVRVFGDLRTSRLDVRYRYRCQVIACDVSTADMLVLPRDAARFGLDPDVFSVTLAVRMSMSIPFYYEPCRLRDAQGAEHLIVDGGLLSGYPVWLLDDDSANPPWPTFGFKFTDGEQQGPARIRGLGDYGKAVANTLLDGHDRYYLQHVRGDAARTIHIPTTVRTAGGNRTIHATDFDLTHAEGQALYDNGYHAAQAFLQTWNFEVWKRLHRSNQAKGALLS